MGRAYSILFSNLTLTAATTLAAVRPPTDRGVQLIRVWLGQNGSSTSKNFALSIGTKASAFSTLTSFTPLKLCETDPASAITGGTAMAAGTAGINASAEGAGVYTDLAVEVMNNLNGWIWIPGPDDDISLKAGSALALCMKMLDAPTSGFQTGWYGGMIFKEIG